MKDDEPSPEKVRAFLREIKRRADEAGVDTKTYLDRLTRALEERRREDIVRRRTARKQPS